MGRTITLQAGREILIKAVVQAIPTYTMHCFKLPIGLCNELEGLIRRFWWVQRGDQRKIHWVRWKELCKCKSEGGMGFKNLALFNDALLANQAWRLLQNKNSLLYRVFKPNFFPNCSFMEASDSQASSFAWRSILKGREVLKEGMRWKVGNCPQSESGLIHGCLQPSCLSSLYQWHRAGRRQQWLLYSIILIKGGGMTH